MKVWPIDPLVPRNLRLEVPEKLPQGFECMIVPGCCGSLVVPRGGNTPGCGELLSGSEYQARAVMPGAAVITSGIGTIRSRAGDLLGEPAGPTLAKVWAQRA
jgi:hypothetical protein